MRDPNKDQNHREKKEIFKLTVERLVVMILGESFPKRKWEANIELVNKVMEHLKDPQFVLEWLTSLIIKKNKSFLDVRKAKSTLQQLQSFLQSKNIVPNQDCANEIHKSPPDSILLNQNGDLLIKAKALQEAEESLSSGENFKQLMAILEQEDQPVTMQQKAVDSFVNMAACDLLKEDSANLVQEHHGVEVEGGQLRYNFPQIPDSVQFNQKGKNAEFHNQERDPPAGNCGNSLDLQFLDSLDLQFFDSLNTDVTATNWDEGTSNEANVKLSHDETYMVQDEGTSNEANVTLSHDETCMVQGYTVFNRNANALIDIFQKHPNIVENFRVAHSDLQSYFMNLLAEVFQKIRKSKQEILGVEDIKNTELMIQDMEYNGLQVTWLKEMLAEVRERLENEKKHRELLEVINSCKAIEKEAKQKLARLEKKRRFQ